MASSKKNLFSRFIISLVYLALIGGLLWQGYNLISDFKSKQAIGSIESIVVNINGNVKQPGRYKVPLGTTNFEILKVAGIRTTSDLTPFNLSAQVESDQDVTVDTLKSPVAIKASVRLEFFFGEVTIISAEGRDRTSQEGMSIDEGNRILTEEKSQAELSVNTYSRIDMDNFSEIVFDKIGIDAEGKIATDIFQKAGLCWYKIAYTEKAEQIKILTPLANITIGGRGADFTVEVKYSETFINITDGLLLVERPDGTDAMNLIAGQSLTIYNDGRPFEVTKLSPEVSTTERFNQLAKTKADIMMKHMPFNFLFCSPPFVFYVISVQFDRNSIYVINLPPKTSVSFFVQGFNTLQEAFLYGGVVFAGTLVERIMNTRIPKYSLFDKNDIIRTASSIGGLKIGIDDKAAGLMNLKQGTQTLKGQKIVEFLRPALSGYEDSEKRQVSVLKSLFNQVRSKNIIVTSLLADQVLTNIETNIAASETMKHYNNFLSRKNWTFKSHTLPVREVKVENKTILEPVLEKSRKLLFE